MLIRKGFFFYRLDNDIFYFSKILVLFFIIFVVLFFIFVRITVFFICIYVYRHGLVTFVFFRYK